MKIIVADQERLNHYVNSFYDEYIEAVLQIDGLTIENSEDKITEYFSIKPEVLPVIHIESEDADFTFEHWVQTFWRHVVRFFAINYMLEHSTGVFTVEEIQALVEYTIMEINHPKEFEERLIQYSAFFDYRLRRKAPTSRKAWDERSES